jgi:hypothetical protein
MDGDRAVRLADDWADLHVMLDPPSPRAVGAVRRMLGTMPEPDAAAAVTGVDGRPRIAALADGAVYLVWAVPASAGTPEAARCRRIPLDPAATAVELSERRDVRHWSFEIGDEPLVFRTTGDDEPERFARSLAGALGWPQ